MLSSIDSEEGHIRRCEHHGEVRLALQVADTLLHTHTSADPRMREHRAPQRTFIRQATFRIPIGPLDVMITVLLTLPRNRSVNEFSSGENHQMLYDEKNAHVGETRAANIEVCYNKTALHVAQLLDVRTSSRKTTEHGPSKPHHSHCTTCKHSRRATTN